MLKFFHEPKPALFYIVALCGALTIPVLTIAGVVMWQYADSQAKHLEGELSGSNSKLILAVERLHSNDIATFRALASSPTIPDGDLGSFKIQIKDYLESNIPRARVVLRDLTGRNLIDTNPPAATEPSTAGIEANAGNRNTAISGIVAGKTFADSYYQIAIPVGVDGSPRYQLVAWMPLTRLVHLIRQLNLAPHQSAVIVDHNGRTLARSQDSERNYGRIITGFTEYPNAESFVWTGKSAQGIAIRAMFRRTLSTRWGVAVGVSLQALYQPLYRALTWLAVMLGSVLLLGGGLAWILANKLTRAFTTLQLSASKLGNGNTTPLPLTRIKEANVIASAMREASVKVNMNTSKLERLVQERTKALSEKSLLLETTLAHMDQGLLMVDSNKHVELYNARAAELIRIPDSVLTKFPSVADNIAYLRKQGLIDRTPEDMQMILDGTLKPGGIVVSEREWPDGTFMEVCTVPLDDGRIICTYADITAQKRTERRLEQYVKIDPLTGLPNRAGFRERLRHAMSPATGGADAFAVFMVHLDGLGDTNELRGYAAGDALVEEFSGRLAKVLDASAFAARLDGAIFAIIQPVTGRGDNIASQAKQLLQGLPGLYPAGGVAARAGVSIGIAMYPVHGASIDELKCNANAALKQAMSLGSNHCYVYERGAPLARAG